MNAPDYPLSVRQTGVVPMAPAPRPQLAPEQVPPARLAGVLLRRKWLLVGTVLAVVPPATLLIRGLPDYYDSQAEIAINTRKAEFRDLQATVATTDADTITIGTQVGIIRSASMAARIVDRLDLTHSPDFAQMLGGKPSKFHQWRDRVSGWLGWPVTTEPPMTQERRRQLAAAVLADKVIVANDGHSYIITIRVRSSDPVLSATIANAYSSVYLDFNRELKIAAIRRANSLLDDEIAPMRERLRLADEAVETYRQKNGLITGPGHGTEAQAGGATVSEQQLAQINAQLIAATGDLEEKQANLHQVQDALHGGHIESLPEVVESPLISTLRTQQTELSSRVASLGQTALASNPALRSATAGSADIQRRINAEIGKIPVAAATRVASAQARVIMLRDSLDRLQGRVAVESRANVALRQLESEASAARTVYQDYLGRLNLTASAGALQEPEADLVSAALVPLGRAGPPRGQFIALSGVGALLFGCLLALVLDRLRSGIRTTEQLEAITGLFALGMVPSVSNGPRAAFESGSDTIYTAAIGQIASVLRYGGEGFRARVVLVTSAAPGEGKTTFAISLAANVGREGGRALLIDCDLYKPAVAATLKLDETLPPRRAVGEDAPTVMVQQEVMPGLDVLRFEPTTGQWGETNSQALRFLIADVREHYDLIVLDAPPVLAFADAPVMSLQADGAILVVRWRHTPVAAINSALHSLHAYGVRVLGGVIMQVKIKELDAAEGGHAHLYRTHAGYYH